MIIPRARSYKYTSISPSTSLASAQPRKELFLEIQKNNSWTFMAHWWTFLTKKNKDIYVEHCFMRQPNPERVYLWTFKKINYEHLWLIDGHFWRKKTKTFMSKQCASPTPKGVIHGNSKIIIHEHLWLIDEHLWLKTQTVVRLVDSNT